jgi:hypothetical protein
MSWKVYAKKQLWPDLRNLPGEAVEGLEKLQLAELVSILTF